MHHCGDAGQLDRGLTPIHLRHFARFRAEDEIGLYRDHLQFPPQLGHYTADRRFSAFIAMLVPQALIDPARCVPLFTRGPLIRLEPFSNQVAKRTHLRGRPGAGEAVLPRTGILKGLTHRLAGVMEFFRDLSNRPPFTKVQFSNTLDIDHLEHLLSSWLPWSFLRSQGSRFGAWGGPLFDDH